MTFAGAVWALLAGGGFGLFQSLNRRAVKGMDVYLATFLQLLVSAVVLGLVSLFTEDLSLLANAPASAYFNFALAALFHFFIGWTFLNLSQKTIGAARTSPLVATNPLFAAVVAAVALGEFPDWLSLIGILLMVGGVWVVSSSNAASATPPPNAGPGGLSRSRLWQGSVFGLAAAVCWAISPVYIRAGLETLPSPLLGVTIGMAASTLAYSLPLLRRRRQQGGIAYSNDALVFKIMAGVLAGVSTWARWVALGMAPVAMVLALTLVSVPVVILLSPIISGRQFEQVTAALWVGATLIVGGSLVLILV